MSDASFGPLEFQLVLLRRMADYRPELVERALRELGVGKGEMREANKRWQARVRGPRPEGALPRYRRVLGEAEQTVGRTVGDLTCTAHLWAVPLWPEFRFEVLTAPDGRQVWNEWLVRRPGADRPEIRGVDDLAPWTCVVDEVMRAFPGAKPLEGSAPTRWGLAIGAPTPCVAHFTWGLLQEVRPLPPRS